MSDNKFDFRRQARKFTRLFAKHGSSYGLTALLTMNAGILAWAAYDHFNTEPQPQAQPQAPRQEAKPCRPFLDECNIP